MYVLLGSRTLSHQNRDVRFSARAFPLSEWIWIIDWLDVKNCCYYYFYSCCCCYGVRSVPDFVFCFQYDSDSVCCASLCPVWFFCISSFWGQLTIWMCNVNFFPACHFNLIIGDVMWKLKYPNGTMPNDFGLNNFQRSKESVYTLVFAGHRVEFNRY